MLWLYYQLVCILECQSFNTHLLRIYLVSGTVPEIRKQNKERSPYSRNSVWYKQQIYKQIKLAAQRTMWSALLGKPRKVLWSRRCTWQRSLVAMSGHCQQRKQAI